MVLYEGSYKSDEPYYFTMRAFICAYQENELALENLVSIRKDDKRKKREKKKEKTQVDKNEWRKQEQKELCARVAK